MDDEKGLWTINAALLRINEKIDNLSFLVHQLHRDCVLLLANPFQHDGSPVEYARLASDRRDMVQALSRTLRGAMVLECSRRQDVMAKTLRTATLDDVSRAQASVRRAIGRLITLLGDEDVEILNAAALAIQPLGAAAVGPLAAALPRGRSPRHRRAILGVLLGLGPLDLAVAARAVSRAAQRDPDEGVREIAHWVLDQLIMRDIASRQKTSPRPGFQTART